MAILSRIVEILNEGRACGRSARRVVIGNAEADEIDSELRRGVLYRIGGNTPAEDVDHFLPLGVKGELFGVEVLRVDQPTIIGVIWDDEGGDVRD